MVEIALWSVRMSVTSEFDAESFIQDENLSVEDPANLQKAQLRAVAQYLQIKILLSARKDALVLAIATHLGLEKKKGRWKVLWS